MKIYLPTNNTNHCYVVQNEEVIRDYESQPTYNSSIAYRDYYIRSDYIYKDGVQSFGNYSTLPICLDNNVMTTNVYYRQDFPNILLMFFIIVILCFYIPYHWWSRAFGKWLKD